jgi:alkylhydroperoxidase/carboxymuconolactone decarboxylase family protein YurZ
VDYTAQLRCLTIHDTRFLENIGSAGAEHKTLDPKSLALARLAGLIVVGGAVPSFGALVDAAVGAGASASEIVDVLVGLIPVVGVACVVAAAPKIALALGHDIEDELLHPSDGWLPAEKSEGHAPLHSVPAG